MKIATFSNDGGNRVGVVNGDKLQDVSDWIAHCSIPKKRQEQLALRAIDIAPHGMMRLIQGGEQAIHDLSNYIKTNRPIEILLEDVILQAPILRPGKVVAIGRNYVDHALETGVQPFEKPRVIGKMVSLMNGPGAQLIAPEGCVKLDFEVELAAIIGAVTCKISEKEALDHVMGYTILNDLTAREFQLDTQPAQTTFAKSMDGFSVIGPWIVTRDDIRDPHALDIHCRVNGEVMQSANTKDMIFPIAKLISYISHFMTLEPGDIVTTGTPAGCGAFRSPPYYLKSQDKLTLEISEIGILEHGIA